MAARARIAVWSTLPALAVCLAGVARRAEAVTVTFDGGAGRPETYTEAGVTVEPPPNAVVHLGDNDGNGSPDLMLHPLCCSTPYRFTFGGGRFTLATVDFVLLGGMHTFRASSGAVLAPTASGTLRFPPDGWRGITGFTWQSDGVRIGELAVVDNLRFCPGSCDDANGCTTDRCDPDDGGAGPDGCTHVPNDESCDDGVFCNGPDRCSRGGCEVHAGDPCAGGPECADTCDEAARGCFVPAGTPCTDDGNLCSDDRCDGAGRCAHGGTGEGRECEEDGDACTADACHGGECVHERLVEQSECTLVQDTFRQALSAATQVGGVIALLGEDVPEGLVAGLPRIRDDLTTAARALGGKAKDDQALGDSPLRHRVRLALAAVRRARRPIAAFLRALSHPQTRAALDAGLSEEVERRGRLVRRGVRTLEAELKRLRRTVATLVRARPPGAAVGSGRP